MTRKLIAFPAALAALAIATGAANGQSDPAPQAQAASDEAVFVRECALCHGRMGTGTMMLARRLGEQNSLLAERRNLAGPYVEYVVRHGVGSMPAITRVEVTDAQLAQIVRYLNRPREAAQ